MSLASVDKPRAGRVAILDLSDLRHPAINVRRQLGKTMVALCRSVGFFYIVNHGVPERQISRMFEMARRFFDLPMSEKQAVSMANTNDYRGYLPMQMIGGDAEMKGNALEAFHAWQEHADDDPDLLSGKALHAKTPWPAAIPDMHQEVVAYMAAMEDLARQMVKVAALGLDLPEDTFLKHFDKPMALLRLMHYPPQDASASANGRFGTRPHTDNGAFTLLAQDDTGGLEILGADGEWIGVPPVPGSYVVNLGEMMKVWTNGLFLATPHRVINRYGKERYSVPFFLNPSFDDVIRPILQETAGVVEPVFHTTVLRDEAATCGEILTRLYKRIWPSQQQQQMK
jgi:isopenicillin N synthase-like dioxygenase